MPRSPTTGIYTAPASGFNAAVPNTPILAADWNALLADLSLALGHAPATTRALHPTLGQVQDAAITWGGVAGGTPDALSIVLTPPITAYVAGLTVRFVTGSSANTGPATLSISGLAATAIRRRDGSPLAAGDLPASTAVVVVYDGSVFRLFDNGPALLLGGGTLTGPLLLPSGTVSAPSLTFAGDTDTGIYRPAADEVGITAGGVRRLVLSSSGAVVTGELRVDRFDTGSEGGRLISRRASDNADSWFWQAHGSGTNPILRLVDVNSTPTVRAWFATSGHLHLTADATASDQAVRFGQLSGIRANVQQFDASGTWTKPTGYDPNCLVRIQCWGGGGSGARHSTASFAGGGGGGGYNERWMRLSALGATETVTIGAGGAAISGTNAPGNPGGNTSFGAHVTAYGGAGGGSGGSPSNYGGGGGGQFSGGSGSTPGAPNFGQGTGGTDVAGSPGFWHGGGGGGGSFTAGYASIWGGGGGGANTGSSGGASINGGAGGAGGGATGTAGSAPGGGGGAGTSTSGAGAAGRVIVTVFGV